MLTSFLSSSSSSAGSSPASSEQNNGKCNSLFYSDNGREESQLLADGEDIDENALSNREYRCLEGILLTRKGRATGTGSVRWKRRFVRLDYTGGGSITVYEDASTLNRPRKSSQIFVYIPSDFEWVAKDVLNTTATFAVEIPTDRKGIQFGDTISVAQTSTNDDESHTDDMVSLAGEELTGTMSSAKQRSRPVRIYFKCSKGSNEKALWLDAFAHIHRFSSEHRHTHGFRSAWSNGVRVISPYQGRARTRMHTIKQFRTKSQQAMLPFEYGGDGEDWENVEGGDSTENNEITSRLNQMCYGKPMKRNAGREYKTIPGYAYPHRWMSIPELYEEMMLPSTHFHDLRDPARTNEEIGCLQVEVLQCVGLPRLDRASDTDAVVYLVCGPAAFATDVIPDRANPMWLSRSRRACIFPIYHGYARLYVGVFDDDGEKAKDDFAGRVVVDIARLRFNSTYDVLLPLRLSTHVYTRRRRGSIRLRFTLYVEHEKDMLLSYIPKKFKVSNLIPDRSKPDTSTTIACADHKAFRNVAITVHGEHMQGRFTFNKINAVIKEMTLVIRVILATIKQEITDIRTWAKPAISAYIFGAWMHCIYVAKFGLVPGYVGIYILLQLLRTYAIFAVERMTTEGFLPPTFEEMFHMLVGSKNSKSLEPLDLHRTTATVCRASGLNPPSKGCFAQGADRIEIKTHEPKGLRLFQFLGFLPSGEKRLSDTQNLHLEFPYADGNVYEKFTVAESMADIRPVQEDESTEAEHLGVDEESETHLDDSDASSLELNIQEAPTPAAVAPRSLASSVKQKISSPVAGPAGSEKGEDGLAPQPFEGFELGEGDEKEEAEEINAGLTEALDASCEDDGPASMVHSQYQSPGREGTKATDAPAMLRKEQDLDWRPPGKSGQGEKLSVTLNRISYNLHSLTLHSFHDYVYEVKNPDSVYFDEMKKLGKKSDKSQKKRRKMLTKKLDRLLGINEYSSSGLVSRVGLMIEPMISAMYGFLCFFRAFYNVVTWQDPYLTFLVFVAVSVVTFVIFFVPWRIVLFAAGMFGVGPQNWLIRVLLERGTLPPPKRQEETTNQEEAQEPDRQIFFSHKRLDGIIGPKPPPHPDPLEVQHIVVPYKRAMYQRFYDWPPEQQYASVDPVQKLIPPPSDDGKDLPTTSPKFMSPLALGGGLPRDVGTDANKKPRFGSRMRNLRETFRARKARRFDLQLMSNLSEEKEGMGSDSNLASPASNDVDRKKIQ